MIVIDMDMPKSCATCKIMCKHKEKAGIRYSRGDFSIPNSCPIKCDIEDIKADITEFMNSIPKLCDCKEGWHNAGQRIGLEQACEIIDRHISGKENDV